MLIAVVVHGGDGVEVGHAELPLIAVDTAGAEQDVGQVLAGQQGRDDDGDAGVQILGVRSQRVIGGADLRGGWDADPLWGVVYDFLVEHPILLNRPVVETPLGTRVCRPCERVLPLLPVGRLPDFTKADGELVRDDGVRLG